MRPRLARWIALAPLAAAGLLAAAPGRGGEAAAMAPGLPAERVTVVAGDSGAGDGRKATDVVLAGIGGLAADRAGNLYFSEIGRNLVRRVDAASGKISTVAGTGRISTEAKAGKGTEFDLFTPGALALDGEERALYIAEVAGKRVLRLDLGAGTIADLGAPPLGFGQPVGLLWTPETLLVVDTLEGQVWSRGAEGWSGLFANPGDFPGGIRNVARDREGNLYLSEFFGHRVLRWQRTTGAVATVAGEMGEPGRSPEGAAAAESLVRTPDGLLLDPEGDLYFADMNNQRVVAIDRATGALHTLYESPAKSGADAWRPGPLFLDAKGALWVGDVYGNRVLRFRPGNPKPEVIAGGGAIGDDGPAARATLSHPGCLAVDRRGNLYIADAMNHRVRRVDAATGKIATVAGTGFPGYNGDGFPAVRAQLNYPGGLLVDGDALFIGDYYSNRVRRVDLQTGIITTVAGSGLPGEEGDGGPAIAASMLNPHALTMDAQHRLIVTSAVAQSVRRIDLATGLIHAVPLDPAVVPPNRVLVFYDVKFWKDGFYLADGMRNSVLFVGPEKITKVVSRPHLNYPMGLAVSAQGELYISDTRNNRVVRWTGSDVEVVADGLGRPRGIALDERGNLFVADTFHNRVLRVALGARQQGTSATGRP